MIESMRRYAGRAVKRLRAAMIAPPMLPQDESLPLYLRLKDGEKCEGRALETLIAEVERRLRRIEFEQKPSLPQFGELQFRRNGLPDWWIAGNNAFFAAPGAQMPNVQAGFGHGFATNGILIMGQHAAVGVANYGDNESMIVIGDRVNLRHSTITVVTGGTVCIGEDTSATTWSFIDARNGGIISVGADGMWASNVNVMTDDMHAIRDLATGERINRRGGKVIIGPHVWLGMDARVFGDSYIGEHSVIGLSSFVKNANFPSNTVSAGNPARVVRTGVTWTRADLP